MTRLKRPDRARWSIPAMPYISPAAIGCMTVRARGSPICVTRSPMARSNVSGHPKPLDALTVMVASLGIRAAPLAEDKNCTRGIGNSFMRLNETSKYQANEHARDDLTVLSHGRPGQSPASGHHPHH